MLQKNGLYFVVRCRKIKQQNYILVVPVLVCLACVARDVILLQKPLLSRTQQCTSSMWKCKCQEK